MVMIWESVDVTAFCNLAVAVTFEMRFSEMAFLLLTLPDSVAGSTNRTKAGEYHFRQMIAY